MKNECNGCRYYDADDDICGALECDGMDCDTPLPCELRETEYTDENAIADLNAIKEYFEEESGGCVPICLEYAIEALKKGSCEDAISRQAVNKLVDELARAISDERCHISRGRSTATIMRDICNLPSVTSAEKVGRWIEKDGYDGDTYYDCSNCGESWTTIDGTPWNNGMKYCPNCGARMEVEE